MFGSRIRRCTPLLLGLAVGAAGVAGAQGVEAPRVPLRTALAEINSKRAEYQQAYNKQDADGLAAIYATDASVIGTDGKVVTGRSAIHDMLAAQFKESSAPLTLSSSDTKVYGNTATDMGTATTSGADGKSMTSHYLVVLRRDMHGWNLVSVANVPEGSMH